MSESERSREELQDAVSVLQAENIRLNRRIMELEYALKKFEDRNTELEWRVSNMREMF